MGSAERIQVLLQAEEKLRLQRQAEREGLSLSAWMRRVALERLAAATGQDRLSSPAQLREFFEGCRAREQGAEPDWELQRALIEDSRRAGSSGT
jgi:hypothetical protein